jgi:alpha-beta hydrolase superfamily lysophospholipase
MNFKLIGQDELQLNVNDYLVENPRAIVLCVHGMCEHSLRYENFALFLNANRYSVYTYDHRGHGKSILKNEEKGYLGKNGFNKMVYDLNEVVTYIREKHPGNKIILFGHSMGSAVTARYLQLYDSVDGCILSGSNYDTKLLKFARFLGKIFCSVKGEKTSGNLFSKLLFGRFNQNFKPNRTPFDWLSRDEKEVDKYISDELCGFTCSNRFYYDFFAGLSDLSKRENLKKINPELPVFIISGDSDPVGNNGKGVKALYQILQSQMSDVEMKLYKNARHELLNEINKEEVYQHIAEWLTAKA